MYSLNQLKHQLELSTSSVTCPVLGCTTRVPRQQRVFRTGPEFTCFKHGIHIGPSTFQYAEPEDNLLFISLEERALFAAIKGNKREDRMARERSEDALTWNVFRGLEGTGRLAEWVASLTGLAPSSCRVHYWSSDSSTSETWAPLAQARQSFHEASNRGSEPDLIIETPDTDIWVEAKFGSNNDTRPSDVDGARARYSLSHPDSYRLVCKKTFDAVAVNGQRYELLRLWLLGSHAARLRGRNFVLVNLVREGQAEDVETFAASSFHQDDSRKVLRATWEDIGRMFERGARMSEDDPQRAERLASLADYMRTRTLGYDSRGRLVKAFRL